jgi:hypothetical protein
VWRFTAGRAHYLAGPGRYRSSGLEGMLRPGLITTDMPRIGYWLSWPILDCLAAEPACRLTIRSRAGEDAVRSCLPSYTWIPIAPDIPKAPT